MGPGSAAHRRRGAALRPGHATWALVRKDQTKNAGTVARSGALLFTR